MTLPLTTTAITILRTDPGADIDPYVISDDAVDEAVATGVPAHISAGGGSETQVGGTQTIVDARLTCEPCDLQRSDAVLDETTGVTYQVLFVSVRQGLGLDHILAGLRVVEGS